MTRPGRAGGSSPARLWIHRFGRLVAAWAMLWAFTAWLQMRPQGLGLLAVLGAFFALCWWAADRESGWERTEWEGDAVGRRQRTSQDSRISQLRRMIGDGADAKGAHGSAAAAAELQRILHDIASDRLRERAAANGAIHLPGDDELIAGTDPRLAAYLLADPPAPSTRQTMTDIINRIEAL